MSVITSRQNRVIVHVRKLAAHAAYRKECREFVCDGRKLLEEALRSRAEITSALVLQGADIELPAGTQRYEVSRELLGYASRMECPNEVLFCCRIPENRADERLPKGRYIVLESLQDPGNVGTIIRTAEAFSAQAVIMTGNCADPYNPKTVQATMGSVFRQRFFQAAPERLKELLEDAEVPLYAAALSSRAKSIRDVDLKNAAVVIGSEGKGVSKRLRELCECEVIIPMTGATESLNAAVAAAVVLYEGARQPV